MANTVEIIQSLADPLLEALKTDNFDDKAFLAVDGQQQKVPNYNDDLVNCSFISWDDFDLWNAWLRVFGLGTFSGRISFNEWHERLQPHWRSLSSDW